MLHLKNVSDFDDLLVSHKPVYHRLYERIVSQPDPIVHAATILNGTRYGAFVDVVYDNYLADIETLFQYGESLLNMRLMRSCIYRFFSGMALQKHSPYTEFINDIILR